MKAIITAAGLGTRLLPVTKELPKEMLPIFVKENDKIYLKPILQAVFEQLFNFGFREFCFIVGDKKRRIVRDHFTSDYNYIEMLREKGKADVAKSLETFYQKIAQSTIVWIKQPEPKGFGDAVLKARSFVKSEDFLVHAGDTYVISKNYDHLRRLLEIHEELEAFATLILWEVEDSKEYGIIEGKEVRRGVYEVTKVIEKPERPPTKLAIVPIYVFKPTIFNALEITPLGKGGELQLTDAIQKLIEWKLGVYAIKLRSDELRLDVGRPKTYWESLKLSYNNS